MDGDEDGGKRRSMRCWCLQGLAHGTVSRKGGDAEMGLCRAANIARGLLLFLAVRLPSGEGARYG